MGLVRSCVVFGRTECRPRGHSYGSYANKVATIIATTHLPRTVRRIQEMRNAEFVGPIEDMGQAGVGKCMFGECV